MTFTDLAAGSAVFVDANVLVYHFSRHANFGVDCTALLDRVEHGKLDGFTSTHVVAEVVHRMMTIEASMIFGWPFAGIAKRLERHPDFVQRLSGFRQVAEQLSLSRIQIVTVSPRLMPIAPAISQQTGLLTNDALIVAVMREHGTSNLASHDADFDRVPGIVRYSPV